MNRPRLTTHCCGQPQVDDERDRVRCCGTYLWWLDGVQLDPAVVHATGEYLELVGE